MEVGAALGKLIDALDGDTDCVEVGAALGKLVCAIGLVDGTDVDAVDGDTVCAEVGALSKLVCAIELAERTDIESDNRDTVCVEVGALGKFVCARTSMHSMETQSEWKSECRKTSWSARSDLQIKRISTRLTGAIRPAADTYTRIHILVIRT